MLYKTFVLCIQIDKFYKTYKRKVSLHLFIDWKLRAEKLKKKTVSVKKTFRRIKNFEKRQNDIC